MSENTDDDYPASDPADGADSTAEAEQTSGDDVPEPGADSSASPEDSTEETAPSPLLNGAVGGVVGIVLSFVPFSTVLGGAVAGYLEGGEYEDGAKVGLIAGAVAFVPLLAVLVVFAFWVLIVSRGGPAGPFLLFLLLGLVVSAFYTIGLAVLGGVVGTYVKAEIDLADN